MLTVMLRYAYFHGFKTGATLLIWGGADAVARLYEGLAQLAAGEGPAALTEIAGTLSVDGATVLFETVGESDGLLRDEVEPDTFHWRIDSEGWFEFQERVEPLIHYRPGVSGHCLLQARGDEDIAVVVSVGEYPDDFKP